MAQYFKGMPLWIVGIAKIVRAGLIIATTNEIIAARPQTALGLMVIREMVGEFINQSDEFKKVGEK